MVEARRHVLHAEVCIGEQVATRRRSSERERLFAPIGGEDRRVVPPVSSRRRSPRCCGSMSKKTR